jgi:hypothetical protein
MITKKLFIKADGFKVCFLTDCNGAISFIKNNIEEFTRLTISFELSDEITTTDFTLIYKNVKSFNIVFSEKIKEIVLECPWNKIHKSTFLPMIFRYIVEWIRQKKYEIKVHASAVEKNGKTILFIAPSEGGKTTIAMAMCQKYGYALKANDASVIKIKNHLPIMLRGDLKFKARANSLNAYSKNILQNKICDFKQINTPWFTGINIKPNEMGVFTNSDFLPVKYIFFIKLDPLVKGCTITKYNNNFSERKKYWFKPKMQIIQNIGGTIRAVDLTPIGNDGTLVPIVIPSLDTKDLYVNRINFVNSLFENCEIYQLRGELEVMTELIDEIVL